MNINTRIKQVLAGEAELQTRNRECDYTGEFHAGNQIENVYWLQAMEEKGNVTEWDGQIGVVSVGDCGCCGQPCFVDVKFCPVRGANWNLVSL